jgi:hypothetical protein
VVTVKNTIAISPGKRITVEPTAAGVTITTRAGDLTTEATLGREHLGAFMFAVENAAEASEVLRDRARAGRMAHELARAGA